MDLALEGRKDHFKEIKIADIKGATKSGGTE